jgi:hypothetical protein
MVSEERQLQSTKKGYSQSVLWHARHTREHAATPASAVYAKTCLQRRSALDWVFMQGCSWLIWL